MKRLLAALLLIPSLAFAQSAVRQSGSVNPGDSVKWDQTGIIKSMGGLTGDNTGKGGNPFAITDNNGAGLCFRSDAAGTHTLCIGHTSSGSPAISIDGTNFPFTGTPGNGTVTGPVTTTAGQIAFWGGPDGKTLSNSSNGPVMVGADQAGGSFGATTQLTVGNSTGLNPIVGQVVNGLAPNTFALPSGVSGFGKLIANGNAVFGIYGVAECRQTLGGSCVGGEVTTRNFTSNSPDTALPPSVNIGSATTTPVGLNVTCGAGGGETKDCSIGVSIANENAGAGQPVFNTGMYIEFFRQYGLVVEAQGSGTQTSAILKNNGAGQNLQLITTGAIAPNNGVIMLSDAGSVSRWNVRQNGDTYINTLQYAGHATPPSIGACGGAGASIGGLSTDAHGTVTVGAAATSCVVNFGTAYTQSPVIVVSGENIGPISVTAKSGTSFTVGGTGLGGFSFDYIVMSNGSL